MDEKWQKMLTIFGKGGYDYNLPDYLVKIEIYWVIIMLF